MTNRPIDCIDSYINEYHGMELHTEWKSGGRINNENGVHFFAIYLALRELNNKNTLDISNKFMDIVDNIRSIDDNLKYIMGLYDRGALESAGIIKENIRTISHDNISAIACMSKEYGGKEHFYIQEYGSTHKWRFDNVYPASPRMSRTMHPRDIVFWSYLAGKFWAKLFMWYVILECVLTCKKVYDVKPNFFQKVTHWYKTKEWLKTSHKEYATSGKLLAFVKLFSIRKSILGKIGWKICNHFINKNFNNGWVEVFGIYFAKYPNHPILKEIKIATDNNNIPG